MADEKAYPPEMKAALFEFQRYLSDQVAPLLFADSMAVLLKHPAEYAAGEVQAWVGAQYRGAGSAIPVSDYLFHAIKKVHHLAEFHLLNEKKLKEYLEHLQVRVLELSPEEDREFLKKNLDLLWEATASTLASAVDIIHRQAGAEAKLATTPHAEDASLSIRRMSALLGRLQIGRMGDGSPIAPADRQQILSHAVMSGAMRARTEAELLEAFEQVEQHGVATDPAKSFRLLSEGLPTWAVPISNIPPPEEWPDTAAPDPIVAMRKVVSIADDKEEAARRLRHMVEAAIELFNEGSLGRAVTMLELADRLIEEKVVDETTAKGLRRLHEQIDQAKLRAYSETKDAHHVLRKVLNFFAPLRIEGLLVDLVEETRRDRRRLMLALLEVHGDAARKVALEKLRGTDADKLDQNQVYFVRNLLYVLNRVPHTEMMTEEEVDLIGRFTSPRVPALIQKESVGALAQTRHDRAERILVKRMNELESAAMRPNVTPAARAESRQALDRVALGLSRFTTGSSMRALLDHALKHQEHLGDTLGRIAYLGSRDLSTEQDLLQQLIAAIRAELPKKILGFGGQKNTPRAVKLIEALSATPEPEVYEVLEEIHARFRDTDFGRTADKVLTAFGTARSSTADESQPLPGLAGDLEVFGLPMLLQSLSSGSASGILTIYESDGRVSATMHFDEGKIVKSHLGLLHGRDAVFQLFEEAKPGTFAFVGRPDVQRDGQAFEVETLIFEAIRRYDELREARLLVPETVRLKATGSKPAPHPAESDAQIVREVWVRASSGERPIEWKAKVPVDSYRIWRLLVHWIDTGALQTAAIIAE